MTAMTTGDDVAFYHRTENEKLPRAVDHDLEMWGCVACNFCVTVCPNDAFFRLPTPSNMEIDGRQQYLLLAELCNECGNCMVFCPENGDPAQIKPKLYLEQARFEAGAGQGFLISGQTDRVTIAARAGYESEVSRLDELLNDRTEGIPIRAGDL
jgi:putative selenate reductase